MPIKGMHDIKTSIKTFTPIRSFRTVIVATSRHIVGGRVNFNSSSESPDWSVKQHEFKKPRRAVQSQSVFGYDLYLDEKIRKYLIQVIQDTLQEMEGAMVEGIPVVSGEIERLNEILASL